MRPPARQARRAGARTARRRRGAPASGSAPTGGNTGAPPPRSPGPRAPRRPGSGCAREPWSMVMARCPGRGARRSSWRRRPSAAISLGVEAGSGAQAVGRVEIDHDHLDRARRTWSAAGSGPRTSATSRAARSAPPPRRARARPRRGSRAGQDGVDRGPEPHDAAAHVERLDRERQNDVVRRLERRRASSLAPHASTAPRHQARMPFWACSRFSASSKTTDCGPSITSSVTSSPRCAGRQCMKIASGLPAAISRSFTW